MIYIPVIIENSKTGGFGILIAINLEILLKNWRSLKPARGHSQLTSIWDILPFSF